RRSCVANQSSMMRYLRRAWNIRPEPSRLGSVRGAAAFKRLVVMTEEQPTQNAMDEPSALALRELARELRDVEHLQRDARRQLADLVEELDRALHNEHSPEQARHIDQAASKLLNALRDRRDEPRMRHLGEQFRHTLERAEVQAPVATGVARRLIDLLADLGI